MPSTYSGHMTAMQLLQFAREGIGGKMGWFWFATPAQVIAIGGPAVETQLVMDASADYLWLALMGDDVNEHIAVPVDFYTVEFSNTSSDRNYQSNPLHSRTVVGTATLPHYLGVPILIEHASALAVRLTALNPLVAYNIRIVLGGVKIYR